MLANAGFRCKGPAYAWENLDLAPQNTVSSNRNDKSLIFIKKIINILKNSI